MPGNTFGTLFRVTTWGESHGDTVGVVIDGCPPGLPLEPQDIQQELDRRRPGQSKLTTQRQEQDQIRIMSGVFEGVTLGTPIAMMIENQDARPSDYEEMKDIYRPSHADMTYDFKYGVRHWMGGGRASARETAARVAAGAVAQKWLGLEYGIEIVGWVRQVHTLELAEVDYDTITRREVETNPVRCPDPALAGQIAERIDQARRNRDSLGGVVEVVARGCPAGWGEPVFDKLEAKLAHHYMSIPASKGVEIGSGFRGVTLTGSQHNDEFIMKSGEIRTRTNLSGGIQGGLSNGMPIVCRIAFKPTATINMEQNTVTASGKEVRLAAKGRHDPCVLPRAVPIIEAVTALVLIDSALQDRAQTGARKTDLRPIR
ncbi:MAG: chorismate synthase [Acidobacteriota bacterium]